MSSILDTLRYKLPHTWENHRSYSGSDMNLVTLSSSSSEYSRIRSMVVGSVKPQKIVRVENPYIWLQYQLKKEECVRRYPQTTEREMWHDTCPSSIESIARNNFDWRRTNRAKYGQGVCFSPVLGHALRYSTNSGAVIHAKVLVGKTCEGSAHATLPSPGCDTATGWQGNVYVRFMDNEFYPEYVVYY